MVGYITIKKKANRVVWGDGWQQRRNVCMFVCEHTPFAGYTQVQISSQCGPGEELDQEEEEEKES